MSLNCSLDYLSIRAISGIVEEKLVHDPVHGLDDPDLKDVKIPEKGSSQV